MFRIIAFALAVLASMTTLAQTTYDPKIAYTQAASGKSTYLYIANADGSRVVRVATGININSPDFAPGGGRIAYSDSQGIKVVSYSASNSGVTFQPPQLLVAGTYMNSPDFSSDGSRIIYRDPYAGEVRAIAVSQAGSPVGSPASLYSAECGWPRWLRAVDFGNAFACYKSNGGPNIPATYEIWIVMLDANYNFTSAEMVLSTATQGFKGITEFDTARTRNALLMAVNYPTTMRFVEFDLVSGIVTDKGEGVRMHYSADDSRIIFVSPHQASGDYVSSLDLYGAITRLSKKGSYNGTDARP